MIEDVTSGSVGLTEPGKQDNKINDVTVFAIDFIICIIMYAHVPVFK